MKRLIALLLLVTLFLGGTATASAEEPFKFSYTMQTKFVDWLNDLKWYPYAKQATNTEVELIGLGASETEYQSGIDQMLISNTFPDAGQVTARQATVYGQMGAFVNLAPYIKENAPHIQAYIDSHPDYASFITAEDGGIYGLASECVRIGEFLFYRADHFKEAGITKMPTTLDEFTDVLRQLKAFYKDVEGESFKKGDDGSYSYLVDFNAEEALPLGIPRWSFLNDRLTFPKPVNNDWFYQWNSDVVGQGALRMFDQVEPSITFSYTAEQAVEYDNLKAVVTPAVLAGTIDFITGDKDFSQWDGWLEEMGKLGYTRMVEIQQTAYDAKYKK